MYTGAPTPILYFGWPFLMYRSILPTGNMTPAFAEREVLVDFFFPPLLDILSVSGLKHTLYSGRKEKKGTKDKRLLIRIHTISSHTEFQGKSAFWGKQCIRVSKIYRQIAFLAYALEPKLISYRILTSLILYRKEIKQVIF